MTDPEDLAPTQVLTDAPGDGSGGAAPAIVGAYRLVRELGRGGMGTVWLGQRADGEYEHQVAIKMLSRDGPRHGQVEQRFRTERQILAALDHPGIAKLLDGGTLDDGTAFIVMEYVPGQRIDHWCRDNDADVRRRVALTIEVAGAVEAAHQRLIVHRDLKPGNILVTPEGQPKLLDFGIAKLLDPAAVDWDAAETELGTAPLTPRYASPEQARGEVVGTASDVFALGVVLYELLTERWPFGEPETREELLRRICDTAARPPSDVHRGAPPVPGLRGELAKDLDAIVLRALAKVPGERYPTIGAFADDLQRALDGWPVLARRSTRLYRARKFLRRHALAAGAGAALVAVLAAAAVLSTLQARALAAERDRVLAAEREAEAQAASAREVTRFLVDILQGADPETTQGREPSLRDLLDRGAARVETELDGQPAVQAPLLEAIGSIYDHLSQPAKGQRLLERAVALRQAERARDPLPYARAVSRLAWLLRTAGEPERAEALSREALALLVQGLGADDAAALGEGHHHAVLLLDLGRYADAERELAAVAERWLAILRLQLPLALEGREIGTGHEPLARVLHARGMAAYYQGRFGESATWYAQALQLVRRLHGDRHTRVAVSLTALAAARIDMGEPAAATALLDEALAIRRAIHGGTHASIAGILVNRAAAYERLDRWQDVERDAAEAERIYAATVGRDHPDAAAARNNRAEALRRLGRAAEALTILEAEVAALERRHPAGHADVVPAYLNLGDALRDLGRTREALRTLRRGTELARRHAGADHLLTGEAELNLARALAASGSDAEASALLRALLARTHTVADIAPLAPRVAFELAKVRTTTPGEAKALAQRALAAEKASAAPDAELVAAVTAWLATR